MYANSLAYATHYSQQLRNAWGAIARDEIASAIEKVRTRPGYERERIYGMVCGRCGWQASTFDQVPCRECGSGLERRLLEDPDTRGDEPAAGFRRRPTFGGEVAPWSSERFSFRAGHGRFARRPPRDKGRFPGAP